MEEMIKDKWKQYLVKKDKEKYLEALRRKTRTGKPFVGEKPLKKLEEKYKIKLGERPKGRPKKKEVKRE